VLPSHSKDFADIYFVSFSGSGMYPRFNGLMHL